MTANTHNRTVIVWDVPGAIERGKNFGVKLGVKCASGCLPEGWRVEVRDGDGNMVASTTLDDEPWPGTAALYHTDIELTAPDTAGLFRWKVLVPAKSHGYSDDIDHEEASAVFNVRTVEAPECRMTVVAIDKANQTPIAGARVVIHPYRAVTDTHGTAELSVPKGRYRLFVSGRDYFPFRSDGEFTADATIRAELDPDLGPSDSDLWS